jgi:hypothetical protein
VREAYHAADGIPVDPAVLNLAPDALVRARLRFAPAVRLVRSQYPVHAIWHTNTSDGPKPLPRAEDALVTRPEFDPVVMPLSGAGPVLQALMEGASVGEAAEAGPDAALGPLFAALLAGGAITAVEGGAG